MISEALTATAVEEAEAIVRAEWVCLQHDIALRDHARREACYEMPAARTCSVAVSTSTATIKPSQPGLPTRRTRWPRRDGPRRRVWPTQRSPPPCS